MINDVVLAITSCGRMDLLEKTLDSFFKFNTYPISKTVIVDDSGGAFDSERIKPHVQGDFEFIVNDKNIGQTKSIDKLYNSISSTYIFHCEDDWEFYQSGFIEESINILEHNPEIITVWLRAHDDTNGHPLTDYEKLADGSEYKFLARNYRKIWHGFTLNPGLRRLGDYKKIAPFSGQDIYVKQKNKTIPSEADLSIIYDKLGFRAVISSLEKGYVRHTGYAHHLPTESELNLSDFCLVKVKNFIKKVILFLKSKV